MAVPVMTKRALRIGITASGGDLVPSAFMSLRKNRQLSFEIHAFNAAFAPLSAGWQIDSYSALWRAPGFCL